MIAQDRLFQAIYQEFYRIAVALMNQQHPGHTLQPTALVVEAVVRLMNGQAIEKGPNRRYLFGAATRAMRQVLVDHHRKQRIRDGNRKRVPLDHALAYFAV